MNESIHIASTDQDEIYRELLPQIRALVKDEPNAIANLANVTGALKVAFPKISWVGFYLWDGTELVLGPFQGKPACVRIQSGKGVCGTAFQRRETVIVADVERFPGHIACDPASQSEIVVPLLDGDMTYGVLDLDSDRLDAFNAVDRSHLEEVAALVVPFLRVRN